VFILRDFKYFGINTSISAESKGVSDPDRAGASWWEGRGTLSEEWQAARFGVVKFKNDYSISVLFVKELLVSGLVTTRWRDVYCN
jgi:hypothetical protein